ncbi:MAG: PEP-CTERM sorting domain-containing protein [Cyanobacteriota bacterium]|nr:PEP-CTERM sorting domain-containing protein [Cyanobacteriota bacterium]
MLSNIFQKTALLGASTVASFALTGTMMANSAQAATMNYISEFSLNSNNLERMFGDSEVATGDFSFTKTELDSGLFSYKLLDFNVYSGTSLNLFGFNESLDLSDVRANPNPFLAVNQAFVPDKYQAILPSVLANEDSNYIGDGDFPPPDFTRAFTGEEFADFANQLTPLVSAFLESSNINVDVQQVRTLADLAFSGGGEISLTTTSTVTQSTSNLALASVPEPTTIFGLGIVGVGLTATRKRRSKKIKQKTAA